MTLLLLLLAAPLPAGACGVTSHARIALAAADALPDGELADLLAREDLRPWLVAGAVFPDGGYAVGDGYGEIAHWEPFHAAYRDWIVATFPDPRDEQALPHVALLLGMAAHGLGDEAFDGLFVERAHAREPEGAPLDDLDMGADILFAASAGAVDPPDVTPPADLLAPLFLASSGHTVDPATIEEGWSLLRIALLAVGAAAGDEGVVEDWAADLPWTAEHVGGTDTPGAPLANAAMVAAYYAEIWDRLNGAVEPPAPLLAVEPPDGGRVESRAASDPEARVTLVFARGLDAATVTADALWIEDGTEASPWLYYGHASHLVHLVPAADWAEDRDYLVTVEPSLVPWDGAALLSAPISVPFTTRGADTGDTGGSGHDGCGCAARRPGVGPGLALLGLAAWLLRRGRPAG